LACALAKIRKSKRLIEQYLTIGIEKNGASIDFNQQNRLES